MPTTTQGRIMTLIPIPLKHPDTPYTPYIPDPKYKQLDKQREARYQQRLKTSCEIPDLWLVLHHDQGCYDTCHGYYIASIHDTYTAAQTRCENLNADKPRSLYEDYYVEKLAVDDSEPSAYGHADERTWNQK